MVTIKMVMIKKDTIIKVEIEKGVIDTEIVRLGEIKLEDKKLVNLECQKMGSFPEILMKNLLLVFFPKVKEKLRMIILVEEKPDFKYSTTELL
jgi:hypothetical protein